ncbi:hypothetical protein PC9H_007316 [Pleurotus ostreatus]|uniref:Uncharacterized protein n=1 Tax=Pleurotus ostreatus TaxID=5322 RepID=A0A8H6ZXX4_PLEOS|nr:uncharacterized protein PC9H_007316 [Pleurotus ostreatus]KAF7428097.1 hypothetical protein PC9H_007316 [Pleurotus ostreatus]KAJ8696156.1 hypothetical protein PTI98_006044 [Pleurotus ostreatus]
MSRYSFHRWRSFRVLIAFLLLVSGVISYIYLSSRPPYTHYSSIDRFEFDTSERLFHEAGKPGKYVLFKQLRGAGFNNQAQEILLYHHLALLSSRIYVYQPLVWRPRGEQSYVPLSAFLRSPTEGSLTVTFFDHACRPEDVKHVTLSQGIGYNHVWDHALSVLNGPERCIVVDDWILNWNYLASSAIHAIWPSFHKYLRETFAWSDKINGIAQRASSALNLRSGANPTGNPYIALHFRRGDFEGHCHVLAERHVGFTTWATLPLLSESIYPPQLNSMNETSTMEHCYPDLSRIIDIIDDYARSRPHLRTLHILHDGAWDHPLVYMQKYKLERTLKDAARAKVKGWAGGPITTVTDSSMVPLAWGEKDWSVAVDVELARNAEVFIGNGYSSLSSQVVALRLGADGGSPEDIRFM